MKKVDLKDYTKKLNEMVLNEDQMDNIMDEQTEINNDTLCEISNLCDEDTMDQSDQVVTFKINNKGYTYYINDEFDNISIGNENHDLLFSSSKPHEIIEYLKSQDNFTHNNFTQDEIKCIKDLTSVSIETIKSLLNDDLHKDDKKEFNKLLKLQQSIMNKLA